jgi:hypothetical protein
MRAKPPSGYPRAAFQVLKPAWEKGSRRNRVPVAA